MSKRPEHATWPRHILTTMLYVSAIWLASEAGRIHYGGEFTYSALFAPLLVGLIIFASARPGRA